MKKGYLNSPYGYALGIFALMVPTHACLTFANYYYVDQLGLGLGLFAIARTIYSIWDAVNNPLIGYLSDRTRTRYGRRKPWIAVTIPMFGLAFLLMFVPPADLGTRALFVWLVAGLILYEGFATILWVNYGALFPELFRGERLRAKASAVKQSFQILAILLSGSLGPLLYHRMGYGRMAMVFALLFVGLMSAFLLSVREDPDASRAEPLRFTEAFRETLNNKTFWVFNIANSFAQTVNGLLGTLIPFYAKYALHLSDAGTAYLLAAVFVSAIPLVAVWYRITGMLCPLHSWRLSLLLYGVSVIPLGFGSNLGSGIVAGIAAGFGFAGFLVTPSILSGQIIDRDAEKTGRRREGIYVAVTGFITRSSGLVAAVAFYVVGMLFGYKSGDEPGVHPEAAFRFLVCVVPVCLLAFSFAVSLFVKIDPVRSESKPDAAISG